MTLDYLAETMAGKRGLRLSDLRPATRTARVRLLRQPASLIKQHVCEGCHPDKC